LEGLWVLLQITAEPQSTPRKRRGGQINKKEKERGEEIFFYSYSQLAFLCASSGYSAALRLFAAEPSTLPSLSFLYLPLILIL
jgi:hypothetical protein